MSLQFIKQMLALFLLALTVFFIVVAISEGSIVYLLCTVISAIVSYLLIKKKIKNNEHIKNNLTNHLRIFSNTINNSIFIRINFW